MITRVWAALWAATLAVGCAEEAKTSGEANAATSLEGSGGTDTAANRSVEKDGTAGATATDDGGGLPGCDPSACDAYHDRDSCDGASAASCIWLEVRVIPEGATCGAGYNEERCLDYRGSATTGGCWGSPTECGNLGIIAETERGTVVARSPACGSFPTCFRYCDQEDMPLCECSCETSPVERR